MRHRHHRGQGHSVRRGRRRGLRRLDMGGVGWDFDREADDARSAAVTPIGWTARLFGIGASVTATCRWAVWMRGAADSGGVRLRVGGTGKRVGRFRGPRSLSPPLKAWLPHGAAVAEGESSMEGRPLFPLARRSEQSSRRPLMTVHAHDGGHQWAAQHCEREFVSPR